MKKSKTSWFNYRDSLKGYLYSPEQLDIEGLEHILNINQSTNDIFSHSIPWIYLLDYTTGRYIAATKSIKNIIGYDHTYFMDGGLAFIPEIYHAKHLCLYSEEIFPDRLEILKKIPPEQHPNYVFSYNLQVKNKQGEYINLLQRNCFVKSDERGNPLLSFGVITNVNHYLSGNPVTQLVEKIDDTASFNGTTVVSKKAYYLNKEDGVFSKRELEVLKWTVAGLTHKEIADRLFIAQGTVLLHRKNMLKKSNTRNVAELVTYAISNRLI